MFQRIRAAGAFVGGIDRAVYLGAAGAVVLAGGALCPWSSVPSASWSTLDSSGNLVLVVDTHWTEILARLLAFLGAVGCLRAILRRTPPGRGTLRSAWLLLAFLLAFPCWHHQWAVEQTQDRRLLFREMNRVIADMEANLGEQQLAWRDGQTFSEEMTATPTALNPSERTWDAGVFAAPRWYVAFEDVLGFSHEFFGFLKPVLIAALLGACVAVVLGLHLASGQGTRGFRRELRWGLFFFVALLSAPLLSRGVGEYLLVEGEQAARRGAAHDALTAFRAAPTWKPTLGSSWWYANQVGQLTRLQGSESHAESFVADAYADLLAAQPTEALGRLRRAARLHPEPHTLDRFLAVVLAEAGLEAFNGGQYSLARDYWEESLHYVPINPTPWYGLALVNFRLKQFEGAARCAQQVAALQEHFGYKRLTVRSQAQVAQSWAAFHRGDHGAAHALYSMSVTPTRR